MSPVYLHQFGGFSWRLVMHIFLTNVGAHVTPTFLLVSGDANLRHSIQTFGEMSWLDLLALSPLAIVLLSRRRRIGWGRAEIFGLLLWGFLWGIAPAALTQESPHALRAIGAWPFLAMMTGGILHRVARIRTYIIPLSATCAAVFLTLYVRSYFVEYPRISEAAFDRTVKVLAISAKQSGDWNEFVAMLNDDYEKLARDYYRMTYGCESCRTAQSAP